jgi:hypothetical protein
MMIKSNFIKIVNYNVRRQDGAYTNNKLKELARATNSFN